MSTISKIKEILGQINDAEYVAITKTEDDGFKGHVVTLDPANIKAIDIEVWEAGGSEPEEKYMGPLCFTAQGGNATVGMVGPVVNWDTGETADVTVSLQISKDDQETWTPWDGHVVYLSECENDKLYVKALEPNTNGLYVNNYMNGHTFIIQGGNVAASGNIQYLIDPTGKRMDVPDNCYNCIFTDCTTLTQAPELPATTLATNCYLGMFFVCESLTQAPELPATTLATNCYAAMFDGCTSLTTAPELPATTLADSCYSDMFTDCSQFSEVHMKSEMNGVYSTSTHGDTTKTVVYDL